MRTSLLYAPILFFLVACSKTSSADKDRELPVISLTTPTENKSFTDEQTVSVSGSVTDNKSIAEIHIVVSDLGTGATYVHAHVYPNAPQSNFSQDFTAHAGINYKIEIIAVDRSVNQSATSVEISCN